MNAALDKKAYMPAILEVGELVGYAEYFVIVSARNQRQVRAIAQDVRGFMKSEHGLYPVGVEGLEASRWVLVDFDDVVLHIFQESARGFYDLEGLWTDAVRLEVPDAPGFQSDDEDEHDEEDDEPLFILQ